MELSSQGYRQSDIADILKVNRVLVNRDIAYLKSQAQENLEKHIHHTIPYEYHKAMDSLNQVLRIAWSIVDKTVDEKTRLQALALINDCSKFRVDLSTNGVVITDAIKYINSKMDFLNSQEKDILQGIKNRVKEDYIATQLKDEDVNTNEQKEKQKEEWDEELEKENLDENVSTTTDNMSA